MRANKAFFLTKNFRHTTIRYLGKNCLAEKEAKQNNKSGYKKGKGED
jgi:hypothetical protein